jgi:hypothetical protein
MAKSTTKSQATMQMQGGKGNLKRNPGKLANSKRSAAKGSRKMPC